MKLSFKKRRMLSTVAGFLAGLATFIWLMERWNFSSLAEITLCLTYPRELLTTDLGTDTPGGKIDFVLIYVSIVIVGYALYRGLKYLVKPGEKSGDHIKR